MDDSNTIEVVIPPRHHNRSTSRQLTVDEALQFTPMTTSVLPAHGEFLSASLPPFLDFTVANTNHRPYTYSTTLSFAKLSANNSR